MILQFMTNSQTSELNNDEARLVVFTVCVSLPFKPTEEQNQHALSMLCRVVTEGMKLNLVAAQCVSMTTEQIKKIFAGGELAEAQNEADASTKQ